MATLKRYKAGAGIPTETRKMVYRRDNWQCIACGMNAGLQIHHAVPRSEGGSDFPDNLVTLCWRCHAVAHGTHDPMLPDYINAGWMEQTVVEYLSEWSACAKGEPWYPYK